MKATDDLNPILMSAMDILLEKNPLLQIDHLPSYKNDVAGCLSRKPIGALSYVSDPIFASTRFARGVMVLMDRVGPAGRLRWICQQLEEQQ